MADSESSNVVENGKVSFVDLQERVWRFTNV